MKSDNKHRYSPDMHVKVRKWIVEVLEERKSVIALPVEQRAKFEGWLKFELAYHASKDAKVSKVKVEFPVKSTDKQNKKKVTLNDISFCYKENNYCINYRIELKTSNTNHKKSKDENRRPFTKNIESIVADGNKLKEQEGGGIVAFVLFPVPSPEEDNGWLLRHLDNISSKLKLSDSLSEKKHITRVKIPRQGSSTEKNLVVCAFTVPSQSQTG